MMEHAVDAIIVAMMGVASYMVASISSTLSPCHDGHGVATVPVGVTDLLDDAVQLLRPLALPLPLQLVSVRPKIQLVDLQVHTYVGTSHGITQSVERKKAVVNDGTTGRRESGCVDIITSKVKRVKLSRDSVRKPANPLLLYLIVAVMITKAPCPSSFTVQGNEPRSRLTAAMPCPCKFNPNSKHHEPLPVLAPHSSYCSTQQ